LDTHEWARARFGAVCDFDFAQARRTLVSALEVVALDVANHLRADPMRHQIQRRKDRLSAGSYPDDMSTAR
jgi:hypothetical protein